MKRLYLTLLALILAALLVLIPAPSAQATEGCIITVAGIKVCGELLGEPLPEVITVTVTPDPIVVPGPNETVTVFPPEATVTVPGPAGPTQTVTEPGETQTVGPSEAPSPNETETVTETTTVSPSETGQGGTDGGTIEPADDEGRYDIDFGDGETNIVEAGIGLLTLLALVGLLLLTLYAGYTLGYKDKERKDTNFMRALLDSVKSR